MPVNNAKELLLGLSTVNRLRHYRPPIDPESRANRKLRRMGMVELE